MREWKEFLIAIDSVEPVSDTGIQSIVTESVVDFQPAFLLLHSDTRGKVSVDTVNDDEVVEIRRSDARRSHEDEVKYALINPTMIRKGGKIAIMIDASEPIRIRGVLFGFAQTQDDESDMGSKIQPTLPNVIESDEEPETAVGQ